MNNNNNNEVNSEFSKFNFERSCSQKSEVWPLTSVNLALVKVTQNLIDLSLDYVQPLQPVHKIS